MTFKNTADYQSQQARLALDWLTQRLLNDADLIRKNDMRIIAAALTTILNHFAEGETIKIEFAVKNKKQVRRKKIKTAASNTRWSVDDDVKLLYLSQHGNSQKVMSRELNRSERSIQCRISLLASGKISR